jgi:Cu2+-exporting ATPase
MILRSGELQPLLTAIHLARRTLHIVHQNLAWALAYNLIAVPLALSGHVTPLAAALGMSLSSIVVVANAMRLSATPSEVGMITVSRLARA